MFLLIAILVIGFLIWLEVIPLRAWIYKIYAKATGSVIRFCMSLLSFGWNVLCILAYIAFQLVVGWLGLQLLKLCFGLIRFLFYLLF